MYEVRRIRCEIPEVTVYFREMHDVITLHVNTRIRRDYLNGEVIWRIVGGGRNNWYFVASDRWINKMTQTP